jgi:ribose transport system permease protein
MKKDSFFERLWGILSRQTIIIIVLALMIIFSIADPTVFLSGNNIHNVGRQVSFDAIIAFGEVIVLIAGGIDLSVGSVLAMAAALTMGLQGYGVFVAVLAALLMGAGVGAFNGFLVTKGKVVPFIVTLGTMTAVYGMMLTYTKQQPIPGKVEWFSIFGSGSVGPIPIPLIIALLLLVVFHIVLTYTRFGRNIYSVGGNLDAARLRGIPIDRTRFWAYVISGVCAALSGVLLASRLNSSTIHIGQQTPLAVIAACIMGGSSILGGRGSIIGAFLGVLALGILANGMNLLSIFTYQQLAIRAILFILVVAVDAFYTSTVRKRLARASAIGAKRATTEVSGASADQS